MLLNFVYLCKNFNNIDTTMNKSYLLKAFIVIIVCVSVFTSCGNGKEPTGTAAEFEPYIERFVNEGKDRGYDYSSEKENVIMQFADLGNGQAGYTDDTQKPPLIKIDRTYWNEINKYEGADLMKEFIVFHELGHGLLKRKHENSVFPNGDWKTMMRGGDKLINGRQWNVNYRGERREYYLNELFDEGNTGSPEFGSLELLKDTSGFVPKYHLEFDGIEGGDEMLLKDAENLAKNDAFGYTERSIDNGLHIVSKFNGNVDVLTCVGPNFPINEDYALEITFECETKNNTDQFGLFLGSRSSEDKDKYHLDFLTINNAKNAFIGDKAWYSYYIQLDKKNEIKSKNTLKIININNTLYYFINDSYIYNTEISMVRNKEDKLGLFLGFSLPAYATIHVNDLLVYKRIDDSQSVNKFDSKIYQGLQFIETRVSPN